MTTIGLSIQPFLIVRIFLRKFSYVDGFMAFKMVDR